MVQLNSKRGSANSASFSQARLFHLLALSIGFILGYTWLSFALKSHSSSMSSSSSVRLQHQAQGGILESSTRHQSFADFVSREKSDRKKGEQEHKRQNESKAADASIKSSPSVFNKLFKGGKNSESKKAGKTSGKYHMVVTADSAVYSSWQVQACYYWYKKVKEEHPDSDLGGFTRLLHTGKTDNLMDIIPTVVVDAEPEERLKGYNVLNRPWAFQQFLEKVNISEDYIFMAEPDHLLLEAMPNWATPTTAAAFDVMYMHAENEPKHLPLIEHFNKKNVSLDKIYPTGNSPVIISKYQMAKVAPLWRELAFEIDSYPPAKKYWGWVLEMWAFALACSQQDPPVDFEIHPEFMLHPPWSKISKVNDCNKKGCELKNAYVLHYTFGVNLDADGNELYGKLDENGRLILGPYRFDKREFTMHYPTLEEVKTFDHPKIKKESPLTYRLVEMIREAIPHMTVTTNKRLE